MSIKTQEHVAEQKNKTTSTLTRPHSASVLSWYAANKCTWKLRASGRVFVKSNQGVLHKLYLNFNFVFVAFLKYYFYF